MNQFVYLLKCGEFYKIGIATDVQSRLAALQTGNPYPLEVVAAYGFQSATPVEASLHQKFKDKNHSREWFSLNKQDIGEFDIICKMLGGIEQNGAVNITDQDTVNAEELGVISNQLPAPEMIEKIKELLQSGYRLELSGSGTYRSRYVIARNKEDTSKSVQIGRVTPEIAELMRGRPGRGNRTAHRNRSKSSEIA